METVAVEQERVNLALHKQYEMMPAPNWSRTGEGETDAIELTDGILCDQSTIFFDPRAVGWHRFRVAQIKLDLGEIQPIDEVAIRLQGGMAPRPEVFPDHVELTVSDDGHTFYLARDFDFWRLGDRQRFGVPEERGQGWVHTLRFTDLRTRGRYVGLSLRGPRMFSDELQVFGGDHDPQLVEFDRSNPRSFSFQAPYVYPVRDTVRVCRDFASPHQFGITLPSGASTEIRFFLDLPEGVRLVEFPETGIHGDNLRARLGDAEKTPLDDGGTRYLLSVTMGAESASSSGREFYYLADPAGAHFLVVQMTTDWPAGKRGEIRYGLAGEDDGDNAAVPMEAVSIGPVPRSERLLTQIGPWGNWTQLAACWTGFLDMCERMGLSAVSASLSHVSADKYPDTYEQAREFVAQARQRGFKIVGYYIPMHFFRNVEETHCILAPDEYARERWDGCPSYRGSYVQREIEFMVASTLQLQPDVMTWDVEHWGGPGPPVEKCSRCRADFESGGSGDWKQWKADKVIELFDEYYSAIERGCNTAGVKMPEIGCYDFVAGTWYQVWDVSRLNEIYGLNSEPSTYSALHPVHIEYMGDEVRGAARHLGPRGRVIPWMSPGDLGLFGPEQMRWAALEYFANGAQGIYFWSHRYWDTDQLIGYAEALTRVHPVQHIVADGEPMADIDLDSDTRVRGMRLGEELFLLIADYRLSHSKTVGVPLPVAVPSDVVDLETGRSVGQIGGASTELHFELTPARRQLVFHVKPIEKIGR